MSLIYGIKTQIGVFLATDTRLTTTLPSGLIKIEDDFGKYHTFSNFMHLIAAGDANLASFLIQKIENSELKNMSYVNFKNEIQKFIQNEIGLYPRITTAKNTVLMFAGYDSHKKEEISMDQFVKYVKLMQGTNNSTKQSITAPLLEAMTKAAIENKKGEKLELERPFIGLFSITIQLDKNVNIQSSEANWGDYLMYGPNGLTHKDAPADLVIKLDLNPRPKASNIESIVYKNSLELIEFYDCNMIPKHGLHTVGGSIITLYISEYGAVLPTGEVNQMKPNGEIIKDINNICVSNGKISTKIGGKIKPLRELIKYYKMGDAQAALGLI